MRTGVSCVVPARLGSTRFFGKLLTPIFDKPVIVHTLERAQGAGCFDRIVCLTDSPEIGAAAESYGFAWSLTGEASNGTERIARGLNALDTDLIVNLQGDEPAFPEDGLRTLCEALRREPGAVHLLVQDDAPSAEDLVNPNRVKVAIDATGRITGFFRTAPAGAGADVEAPDRATFQRGPTFAADVSYRLQMGAYAYHHDYLAAYAALPPSAAELELSHEMLRAPGLAPLRAHALPSKHDGASVDVPEDLIKAQSALSMRTRHTLTPASTPETFAHQEQQPTLQGAPA